MNRKLFGSEPDESGADLYEDLPPDPVSESQARSSLHGREFDEEAFSFLEDLGARIVDRYVRVFGLRLDAEVEGSNGKHFFMDAHGTPDRTDRPQAGMRRQDTMLKFGFKALRLQQRGCRHPLLLITSHLPKPGTSSAYLLTELNDAVFDAVATVGDLAGQQRLRSYLNDVPPPAKPLEAPWRAVQLELGIDPFDDDQEEEADA